MIIQSGCDLHSAKEQMMKKIRKDVNKDGQRPVKWNIDGVFSYVNENVEVVLKSKLLHFLNQYSKAFTRLNLPIYPNLAEKEKEKVMEFKDNKVQVCSKKFKGHYFGEFAKNGECYMVAKHKFVGA